MAINKANKVLTDNGGSGGIVSMSWGTAEVQQENSYDSSFNQTKVTYLAAAGDAAGTEWPSVSANVIAVGGTSIYRDQTGVRERAWQQTGGGLSAYVPQPPYQLAKFGSLPGRVVPDIAADANPATGVWVYSRWACAFIDSCLGNWIPVGGTSVASPVEAGILSQKGVQFTQAQGALRAIYSSSYPFRDITAGDCGIYDAFVVGTGWDLCTGFGGLLGPN